MTHFTGYDYERKFLEIVEELREKKGIAKKTFAEQIFPQEKDANKKYHTILKGDAKAKPQRVKLGEAYEMSRVLQYSMNTIEQEAERRLAFTK